ncbi:MAG: O-antigen ligase [Phenylobacterium sp.]
MAARRPATSPLPRLPGTLAVSMLLIFSAAWVLPLTGDNPQAAEGGLVRTLYLPAYALGLGLFALRPLNVARTLVRQPFLVALMALAVFSVVWSIAPDQTARRVFAVICTTAGGFVLAARFTWAELAEAAGIAFAILAVAALLAALFFPSIGVMHELFPGAWRGLWPEKNALGGNMALGFTCLAAAAMLNPSRAPIWWGFAALCLFLVLMSTSKTSLVSLLLGAGMLTFVAMIRRSSATAVAVVWLAVVGLGVLVAAGVLAADALFDLLGKDATLTGRTEIWAAAMRQIEHRPWTGYGYGVVWSVKGAWTPFATIAREAGFTPQHAHNVWIEQWLGLGIFGLGAFILFYLQTTVLTVAAVFRHPGAYFAAPFVIVYSLMSITESIGFTYNDLRWVLLCAIASRLVLTDEDVDPLGEHA